VHTCDVDWGSLCRVSCLAVPMIHIRQVASQYCLRATAFQGGQTKPTLLEPIDLSSPSLHFPFLPSLFLSFPSTLCQEVAANSSSGQRCQLPSGVRVEPQPQKHFWYILNQGMRLVATISTFFVETKMSI